MHTIDPLLLTAVHIITCRGNQQLTNASGFFFKREQHLFLVTNLHVMLDEASGHHPDNVLIELHTNANNLAESTNYSIPLYDVEGNRLWRQGIDSAGSIDVVMIEIDQDALPETTVYRAFTPDNMVSSQTRVDIGSSLLVIGFPLGFHDTLHHMPVARHAILSSSYGLRFQGEGYFLTDARTHRGTSGAPIVMRKPRNDNARDELPWLLLGIHSARLDVGTRDIQVDEALGLNCAWYADILMTLSAAQPHAA